MTIYIICMNWRLGETFFIHWFTDPPTVNIQKVKKNWMSTILQF